MFSYLRSDGAREEAHDEPCGDGARLGAALALLAASGAGAAFTSDWFVAALRPAMDSVGVSDASRST